MLSYANAARTGSDKVRVAASMVRSFMSQQYLEPEKLEDTLNCLFICSDVHAGLGSLLRTNSIKRRHISDKVDETKYESKCTNPSRRQLD